MSPKNSTSKQEKSHGATNGVFKYIGISIVALAVIGLIFSSVSSGFGGNRSSYVFGTYGDREIEFRPDNAFGRAVDSEMSKYSSGVDQGDQFFGFVRLMAWQQAFNSVVVTEAISFHLDDSGYAVSPRAVDRRVVEYGPYRSNGEFDENLYRSASTSQKALVREQFREQMAVETWSRDVLDSQYRSDAQLEFLQDMRSAVKTYDYVSIPFTSFPDAKVITYAEENPGLFQQLPVSRITVSDEKTAQEVLGTYNQNSGDMNAFADLATERSSDAYAEDGGDMGLTDFYRLVELIGTESSDLVFSTSQGDVSGPFETDYGWMLFRVDGTAVDAVPSDRIEDIRSYMLQNELGLVEDSLLVEAEQLKVEALAAGDFRLAAAAEGYEVLTTASFPVNYGSDSLIGGSPETGGDPQLSGSSDSDAFWRQIIPLQVEGSVSDPVVMSGAVALFSLASVSEEEPLDYWESLVDYEIARSRQTDFQAAILSDESDLFTSNFSQAYSTFFPEQG